jgi:hypothetical protein
MATPIAIIIRPILDNSELESFDNISNTLGILPGAIAKKNPQIQLQTLRQIEFFPLF